MVARLEVIDVATVQRLRSAHHLSRKVACQALLAALGAVIDDIRRAAEVAPTEEMRCAWRSLVARLLFAADRVEKGLPGTGSRPKRARATEVRPRTVVSGS